jgi:DNA-binding MarR family transcriptional regulator
MEKHSNEQERDRIAQLAAMCVCSNLRRASRAVTNYYDNVLAQVSDLRVSQAIVLVVLYLAGPQTIHELGEMLALDRTTIGRNLKPLAQQHLVTLTSGKDKRTRMVALTAQGVEALVSVVPQWEQAQAHMVLGLGQDHLATFFAQLAAVTARTHEV